MNLQAQVLADKASEFDQVWIDDLTKELNTVKYGYATPFFWIEMPDANAAVDGCNKANACKYAVVALCSCAIKVEPVFDCEPA